MIPHEQLVYCDGRLTKAYLWPAVKRWRCSRCHKMLRLPWWP